MDLVLLNTLGCDAAAKILTQGTALRAVMRNVGGSVGISILSGS